MKELLETVETMERIYEEKFQKAKGDLETKVYFDKLCFLADLREVLYMHDKLDKFIEFHKSE